MKKIIKYVLTDILRNRIVIAYTAILLLLSFSVLSLEDNSAKGLLSLLNIILIIVPLVSIVFATIYLYNSAEFIELLVSQPIQRKNIWLSLFLGLSISMMMAFFIGAGILILIFASNATGFMLLVTGILLTIIFTAIAMLATVRSRDKARGIGLAILLWLYFSVLFDGLVLLLLFQLSDYPLEKWMVGVSVLNPIDLARILILLKMDLSAMMGYTGAVFKNYFGTFHGITTSILVLLLWAAVPAWLSVKRFKSKDL